MPEASSTPKHQAAEAVEVISDPSPMRGQEIVKATEAVNRRGTTRDPETVGSTGHRTAGRDHLPTLLDSKSLEPRRQPEIKVS